MSQRVITFGTFDLLHIGHLNIFRRAKQYGNTLVVGVSTDDLNFSKKGEYPVYRQSSRAEIVSHIDFVDEVFFEESLELKREYILGHRADVLVMGADWEGKFDRFKDICKVIYLPRTRNISTTETKSAVKQGGSLG